VREVFFGEREETVCQPGGREFMLENLRDLQVCIVWAGLSGTYWTQLEFLSPDGHVYQTMTQAFVTPEATATVGTVEVQGRPYQVQRAGWARPGEAVRRRDLVRAGWPHGAIVRENTLDAYVARLRRKLRALADAPEIATVHGVGYRIG